MTGDGLVRRPVRQLQAGDRDLGYGTVLDIKKGVVRWTVRYDSNAVMKLRPDETVVLLKPS